MNHFVFLAVFLRLRTWCTAYSQQGKYFFFIWKLQHSELWTCSFVTLIKQCYTLSQVILLHKKDEARFKITFCNPIVQSCPLNQS